MKEFDENKVKQAIKENTWKGDFEKVFQEIDGEKIVKKRKKHFMKSTIVFASSLLALCVISSTITASVVLHQNGTFDRCYGSGENRGDIHSYLSQYPYYSSDPIAYSTGDEEIYAKYYYASMKNEERYLVVSLDKNLVSSMILSFFDPREPINIKESYCSIPVSSTKLDFTPILIKSDGESYAASPLFIDFAILQKHFGF